MKSVIIIVVIGVLLALGLPAGTVWAYGGGHGGGGHFNGGGHFGGRGFYGGFYGGYFGFPYGYPYWGYPYDYPYAYPYSYAYTEPSVTYSAPQQNNYWYFCKDAHGYYPYVTSCPRGWLRVVPTPPQQ